MNSQNGNAETKPRAPIVFAPIGTAHLATGPLLGFYWAVASDSPGREPELFGIVRIGFDEVGIPIRGLEHDLKPIDPNHQMFASVPYIDCPQLNKS